MLIRAPVLHEVNRPQVLLLGVRGNHGNAGRDREHEAQARTVGGPAGRVSVVVSCTHALSVGAGLLSCG